MQSAEAGVFSADSGADASTPAPQLVDTSVWDAGINASEPTACVRNSDCDESPEAANISGKRCASEVYCSKGRCHAACSLPCRPIREDVEVCGDGAYCDSALNVCRYRPAKCATAATCPTYRKPLADGGLGTWSCENGLCVYPEFIYPAPN